MKRGPRERNRENRLPPAVAVLVAGGVYAALPNQLLLGPRIVVPALEAVLLVAMLATSPRRKTAARTRASRILSIALSTTIIVANLIALGLLVRILPSKQASSHELLLGSMQVWVTSVIGFGLLYWELDRGGPVARHREPHTSMQPADWRFSQDENHDAIDEVAVTSSAHSEWRPTFADYLYLSLTNSSAFSPTDTMPLTARAKCLMGLQASAALLTSLLVVARAVGSLGS